MKQLLLILLLIFTLQRRYIASEELASAVPSAEQDQALEQWVADLEPVCEFEVTEEYPGVILELFDQLTEQRNQLSDSQQILNTNLQSVTVYGTQQEFCAIYTFSSEQEYLTESGSTRQEPFGEMTMRVRMRQKNKTTYELVAQGGGPIAYGLEKTDLTLESIQQNPTR
ncbi:hypothetical protein H9X81_06200 [Hydrogenoanaerobacterium saccharovorans]|jgi:hypothetical protein|uniref:Uncharacterized protein n=1 Tax=Hydrogenoanaerobacterium saccharovorans TaxID=474960 RepID=A0ABS2GLE1_9FIRM|nr:hypothetical protein [Hydrogenoanaerobacterium saccharovorans]MBM6923277.1 hypothetical protein [Hydrogenoanaerobacterium saccharovorans]